MAPFGPGKTLHVQPTILRFVRRVDSRDIAGASACSKGTRLAAAPPPPPTTEQLETEELGQPSDPRFIGRIWVSTTPGHVAAR